MKALWAFLIVLPSAAVADTLTLPLTAAKLYQHVQAEGLTTKRELLASLPEEIGKRVVLISDSRSRHKSTPERPRVVHWSPDARFIMAHSGHALANDANANDIEILQVNESTGRWQFLTMQLSVLGFSPPLDVTQQCGACHGTSPRPIWGPYPEWPHAYQGSLGHYGVDAMTPDERADFGRFLNETRDHDAYSHLDIDVSGRGYGLGIEYGLPNTHFGARLGTRHAAVVFDKLRQSPHYRDQQYRLVRLSVNSRCAPNPLVDARVHAAYQEELHASAGFERRWASRPTVDVRTKLYRLLGIDPIDEMRLDRSPVTPVDVPEASAPDWNIGSEGIGGLVEFQAFYDLLQTDPWISGWFRNKRSLIDGTHWAAFEATAEEIVAMAERSRAGIDERIKQLDRERYRLLSQWSGSADVDTKLALLWQAKHDRRDYFSNGLVPFLHFNVFAPVLETEFTEYVPMKGEGHKEAFCVYLTQKALE